MYLNNDTRNILFRTLRHHLDMSLEDVAEEYNKSIEHGQIKLTAHILLRYQQGSPMLNTNQQIKLARMLIKRLQDE